MSRRLGPEEAKYWLLSQARPFNIVLALGIEDWKPVARPELPSVHYDLDGLPRWTKGSSAGHFETVLGRWLDVAQAELNEPVGGPHQPPWRMVLVQEPNGLAVLLLTLNHALVDARGGLVLLTHLIEGRPVPIQPPSFEELLAVEAYPEPSMADEVMEWWSQSWKERLRTLDLLQVAALLPVPRPTVLQARMIDPTTFSVLRQRCRQQNSTVHGAIVAALTEHDTPARTSHAVDMRRFLPDPFSTEAWFAMSHIQTTSPLPGTFWQRSRQASQSIRLHLADGSAGFSLLELQRTLQSPEVQNFQAPPTTVSNSGRMALPSGPHGRGTWFMALAGGNAGGRVLAVGGSGPELRLVSATPDDMDPLPLDRIEASLRGALSA